MNNEKVTDAVVSVCGFRIGRLELFPFQFPNPACMHPVSISGSFWLFVSGMVTR